jgi:tRNA-splicing ligase RtcB
MKRASDTRAAVLHQWTAAPPPHDVQDALARLRHAEDVARVAVMPDVHLAEDVCIGTVVATRTTLLPAAVGGDIGCGMAAIAFDADADLLADQHAAAAVLDGLMRAVPTQRWPDRQPLPDDLAERPLSDPALEGHKRRIGGLQLGTLGRGNHFLELQADDAGRLWLMVHSGSRGLGQAIRDHHDARAARLRGGLRGLPADTQGGAAYLADMAWALDYAARNRERLRERAADVLWTCLKVQAIASTAFACHHNFVRRETHDGEALWVHRKGAISAQDGEARRDPRIDGRAELPRVRPRLRRLAVLEQPRRRPPDEPRRGPQADLPRRTRRADARRVVRPPRRRRPARRGPPAPTRTSAPSCEPSAR